MLVERMQHFVLPVSAVNAQPLIGLKLQVDLDAPFRLFGVAVWNLGVPQFTGAEGQIALRFERPDGRLIQRQLAASNQLFPGNQYNQESISPNKAYVSPIRPGVLYPAGSVIEIDVQGLPTGIVNPSRSIIVFVGTNIYQQGTVWSPGYPKKPWTARPYLDNLTVTGSGFPIRNVPFTAQADSDFVWQCGEYTDLSSGGAIDQFIDLGIMIRDPGYKAYSNDYVPAALLFPFLNAQAPGWLYPEIYVPRLTQLYFDFNLLT